jgi:cytochrome bd-type quinol oxidase subunit 2
LIISIAILLVALVLITKTLKNQSHLMLNEKYMVTHFVFLFFSAVGYGFIIRESDFTARQYKFWCAQISFDFVSVCVLAIIFSSNSSADRASESVEIQGTHGGMLRYGREGSIPFSERSFRIDS